jgi:hypothetical protein
LASSGVELKRRGRQPEPPPSLDFYRLDSAKNDLPGQFLKALRSPIEKRASYDKRFRKPPWMPD